MDVDHAEARQLEDLFGDELAVCHYDAEVWRPSAERRRKRGSLQLLGLKQRQPALRSDHLDGGVRHPLPSAAGAI